jgi:hypothetical protein
LQFAHIFPPISKGAKQVWQVSESRTFYITSECKIVFDKPEFILDVINLDKIKDNKMPDTWGLTAEAGREYCFFMEATKAVIGFDDPTLKRPWPERSSISVSEDFAKKNFLNKIREPTDTYYQSYVFINPEACKCCAKQLQSLGVGRMETLSIGGVGSWSYSED